MGMSGLCLVNFQMKQTCLRAAEFLMSANTLSACRVPSQTRTEDR